MLHCTVIIYNSLSYFATRYVGILSSFEKNIFMITKRKVLLLSLLLWTFLSVYSQTPSNKWSFLDNVSLQLRLNNQTSYKAVETAFGGDGYGEITKLSTNPSIGLVYSKIVDLKDGFSLSINHTLGYQSHETQYTRYYNGHKAVVQIFFYTATFYSYDVQESQVKRHDIFYTLDLKLHMGHHFFLGPMVQYDQRVQMTYDNPEALIQMNMLDPVTRKPRNQPPGSLNLGFQFGTSLWDRFQVSFYYTKGQTREFIFYKDEWRKMQLGFITSLSLRPISRP